MKVQTLYTISAVAVAVTVAFIASSPEHLLFARAIISVPEPATLPITHFCTGRRHGCASFNNNKLRCWGAEEAFGFHIPRSDPFVTYQDNLADELSELGDALPFIDVHSTGALIEDIFCGLMHTCIKFQSAGLKCIGVNRRGQTGQGVTDLIVGNESGHTGNNLPYVNVGTGLQVLDAALGYDFTCVLVTGNKVKCFGRNDNGSLGNGNTTNLGTYSSDMGDNLPFVSLGTGVEVASIITGVYSKHACIIASKPVASAQRVKCWGYNNAYQLGYGDLTNRGDAPNQMGDALPFVNFGTESKVKTLALTIGSSCALLINDVLKCWGFASNGELGSGSANWVSTTGNLLPAIPIDSGKVIKTLSFGASHMCILYDDEVTLKCTGYNGNGQLGQGDTTIRGETPSTTFPSIPAIKLGTTMKIKVLQSGGEFNCVMFENFLIKCWGSNESGQLGIGSKTAVGTSANQMAYRLEYVKLFSPTASPTNRPTANPTTGAPTTAPTFSPTKKPTNPTTKAPTASPTKTPTRTPTTLTPTKVPATATPTKSPITYSPTIRAPTTIAPNVGQTTSKPTASMGFTSARVKIATGFVVVVSLIILMVA